MNAALDSLRATRYLLSVHQPSQLPVDSAFEVAVCGRSNAGKSSALNAICGQGKLARTSKTPGRTQQLVYFQVAPSRYLVDLPGYGYAEVPEALREHWRGLIDGYLRSRQTLVGLLLVMDVRHPLKPFDRMMLDYAGVRGLPAHVLLSKADKLPRGQQAKTLLAVQREIGDRASAQLLSAPHKLGVEQARELLVSWLRLAGSGSAADADCVAPRSTP